MRKESHPIEFKPALISLASVVALSLAMIGVVGAADGVGIRKLRCSYNAPSRTPTESAAVELSKFWRKDPPNRALYLTYDPTSKKVALDPELDSLAGSTAAGPPPPGSMHTAETVAFSVDMRWLADLKVAFETARVSISIDLYSLESSAIIELVKPGQKSELYKTAWVRHGQCVLREL